MSFETAILFCFAQSFTAGRNIATTGVLFMNALTKVTGTSSW